MFWSARNQLLIISITISIILIIIIIVGAFISIVSNQLKAPQGWKLLKPACQWALLNIQIITLLFPFTVQKYIYPPDTRQSACCVFSHFRNPPNSDMNYRICNVRTWSFLCVCIYTRRLGTPTGSQHNIFDFREKTHKFVLCSWRDSNLGLVENLQRTTVYRATGVPVWENDDEEDN